MIPPSCGDPRCHPSLATQCNATGEREEVGEVVGGEVVGELTIISLIFNYELLFSQAPVDPEIAGDAQSAQVV